MQCIVSPNFCSAVFYLIMRYKPDFLIIPYCLYEDDRITALDAKIYGIIYYFANMRNERCTASNESLAEFARTTSKTVQNSLTNLESCGYIRRIFADEQKKQRSEIIPLVVMGKVSPTDDTRVTHRLHEVSPTGDQISNSNKEKIIRVSEETQYSTKEDISNSLPKDDLSGITEYDVVPTNEEGEELTPRKKPQTWDVEKRVFDTFVSKAKEYTGVEPEPAKLWQLKQIRAVLPKYSKQEILEIFDDWFNEAPDTVILNIHSALSAHNLNKYKMKK